MKSARSLEFDPAAFEDLAWWIEQDRKKAEALSYIPSCKGGRRAREGLDDIPADR